MSAEMGYISVPVFGQPGRPILREISEAYEACSTHVGNTCYDKVSDRPILSQIASVSEAEPHK
jgi:hypothetical protein